MFVREMKLGKYVYLTIIESYWQNGKSKHRFVANLGRVDKLRNTDMLYNIANKLLNYCSRETISEKEKNKVDMKSCKEIDRKIWGAPYVIRKMWSNYSLDEMFKELLKDKKIKFDFFSACYLMVMDRICSPQSKLKSYEKQNRYAEIKENELQNLYKALDILSAKKEEIEKYLFNMNVDLFNIKVDVVFYDVTTIYFESFEADEIRERGYSKDMKIQEVQIVVGLLIDQEGRPIGFDIFPGNTYEGNTLKYAIEKLKKRLDIKRLIFVGDEAILSRENLRMIKEMGYEYVVGSRIRSKMKGIKEKILDEKGYIEFGRKEEEEKIRYKEIEENGDRIISVYSEKRKMRDRKERETILEKAKKMIEEGISPISKRGVRRYIKIEISGGKKIDEEKIKEDEKWDGYYGLQTNCQIERGIEVIEIYHNLWKIEEAFRVLKSHLEARPIFHWTPKRIKGHMVLCFIAFLLERNLEIELKKNKIEYSHEKLREELNKLQYSELEIEGKRFYVRSKISELSKKIMSVLKIKIPPQVSMKKDDFCDEEECKTEEKSLNISNGVV